MWEKIATWEWVSALHRQEHLHDDYWLVCSPSTCQNFQELMQSSRNQPVGRQAWFVDSFVARRKFKCTAQQDGMLTIQHDKVKDEGAVTLYVRPIARKLIYCTFNARQKTLEFTSMFSGEVLAWLPYEEHKNDSWGWLTLQVEKKLHLKRGKMYLFPPSVVDPEQIEAWKKKPQNR